MKCKINSNHECILNGYCYYCSMTKIGMEYKKPKILAQDGKPKPDCRVYPNAPSGRPCNPPGPGGR